MGISYYFIDSPQKLTPLQTDGFLQEFSLMPAGGGVPLRLEKNELLMAWGLKDEDGRQLSEKYKYHTS